MRVLAIDTSSNVATVAVMEDELLLGEYILNHKKTHSQKIMTCLLYTSILVSVILTATDLTKSFTAQWLLTMTVRVFTQQALNTATV